MEQNNRTENASDILLKSRKAVFLDGVTDILSFDEQELLVRTSLGKLSVEGNGLHITSLSLENGKLNVEGEIDALTYLSDGEKKKAGLFRRKG